MRTRHAIMFRLSNKVVQVNFQDHTEIMLSSETKVVTYVNKRGERSTYPLNSAMESANVEMVKRLKYTKDILTHMLNQNAGNSINRPGQPSTVPGNIDLGPGIGSAQSSRPGEIQDFGIGGFGAVEGGGLSTKKLEPFTDRLSEMTKSQGQLPPSQGKPKD